jgi:predicted O-linked N-acetylglucosamine transferase (SPINDLY family)
MTPEVEQALREERAKRVAALIDTPPEAARTLFSGAWKDEHLAIAHGGLRDLPREEAEEKAAAALRGKLARDAAAPGPILAAMLLLRVHEVPLPADLEAIPEWLMPTYARFLMAAPRLFHEAGDAERYGEQVERALRLLHRHVLRSPPAPLAEEICGAFVEAASFMQLYFNERNLRDVYRMRAELMERWLASRGAPLAHRFPVRAARERKIRVGVLCDHYYSHTETYFTLAHLERFPRKRCELILYALQETGDPLERHARGVADRAVTLPPRDADAIERLRADELDVLVIGSNVTVAATRWAVLACHRLARVQAISGSSPVSTGMTSADWYLGAEENETEEGARTQFTERVFRMPGTLTRYAYYHDKQPATLAPSREEFGIPQGDTVFFSGANFFKLIPDLSARWAGVMAGVPGAWLILMPFNQNWSASYLSDPFCSRILEQVDAAGGDASRVLILDPVPARADLHRVMSLADVYLDSFPFAGACSLLDPLLVGLPVVAHDGRTFRGKVGAAMLRGLGLGDMALADPEAYVARAIALGKDPKLRAAASGRIRAALTPANPVFDSETASRNFEAALVEIVRLADEEDAALLRADAAALRASIERLVALLERSGNPWLRGVAGGEIGDVLRSGDGPALAAMLRLLLSFLPPREREAYLPRSTAPTK